MEGCARAGAARAVSWGEDLPSTTVGEAMAPPRAFDFPESAHFGIAFEMLDGPPFGVVRLTGPRFRAAGSVYLWLNRLEFGESLRHLRLPQTFGPQRPAHDADGTLLHHQRLSKHDFCDFVIFTKRVRQG